MLHAEKREGLVSNCTWLARDCTKYGKGRGRVENRSTYHHFLKSLFLAIVNYAE